MDKGKSLVIPKNLVWEAYLKVKRNKGSAGVDEVSIVQFETNLKSNLYKLWNRMSSGSYFPPPVKLVEIPKKNGSMRTLGIPTVADRIAQMVVTIALNGEIEPSFDVDSYGYRPCKSALDAVAKARERCWKHQWAIDVDIKGFFDNLDHELLIKALHKHTKEKWMLLYIKRWLKASAQQPDGTIITRSKGTPQGGVISPLLANLFMHYAFDKWMRTHHPQVLFERYADDILVHCKTKAEAQRIKLAITGRLSECKLSLNEDKSKIIFCGVSAKENYAVKSFDFLGFTFRRRKAMSRENKGFTGFLPAVSKDAKKKIGEKIKRRTSETLQEISNQINPILRGWYNYYGKFYHSELNKVIERVEISLRNWVRSKFKTKNSYLPKIKVRKYLGRVRCFKPNLFEHWKFGLGSPI